MRLLAVVEKAMVNGRAVARVDYTGTVPLGGDPPRPGLVALDCPGLAKPTRVALLAWLAKGGARVGQGRALEQAEAGALDAVPEDGWRTITYGEAVALPNFEGLTYLAAGAAPLGEISACLGERMPALLARIDEALTRAEAEQITALRATHDERRLTPTFVWGLTSRAESHITELSERVDAAALSRLLAQPFDVDVWVRAAAAMRADLGRANALVALVGRIPEGDDAPEIAHAIVARVSEHKALVRATRAGAFWSAIAPLLAWSATLREGEVSLVDATEVVVAPSWEVWNARRVGRLKLGRKALLVPGNAGTYVRGTHALLKHVIDAGGRLRHHGVTLTYPTHARPLTPRLVDVERIDTLAYLDPRAALEVLPEAQRSDALVQLALRAETDPALGRVLADHLIEYAVGIDADVARKLARGHR